MGMRLRAFEGALIVDSSVEPGAGPPEMGNGQDLFLVGREQD